MIENAVLILIIEVSMFIFFVCLAIFLLNIKEYYKKKSERLYLKAEKYRERYLDAFPNS